MNRNHVLGAALAGGVLAFVACATNNPNPAYTTVYVPEGGSSGDDGGEAGGDDSGDDSGDDGGGGSCAGNCPAACPEAGTNCCLVDLDAAAGPLGTCMSPSACATAQGAYIGCGMTPDPIDCPSGKTSCCLLLDGGSPTTVCAASCPETAYACNTDQSACPPDSGKTWTCQPIPGTNIPVLALGQCVAVSSGDQ
jgi:hypothetical protein